MASSSQWIQVGRLTVEPDNHRLLDGQDSTVERLFKDVAGPWEYGTVRKVDKQLAIVAKFAVAPSIIVIFAINTNIIKKRMKAWEIFKDLYANYQPLVTLESVAYVNVVNESIARSMKTALYAMGGSFGVENQILPGGPGWDEAQSISTSEVSSLLRHNAATFGSAATIGSI